MNMHHVIRSEIVITLPPIHVFCSSSRVSCLNPSVLTLPSAWATSANGASTKISDVGDMAFRADIKCVHLQANYNYWNPFFNVWIFQREEASLGTAFKRGEYN